MDIETLRQLLEMAYLHAWGKDGSAELRDTWRTLKQNLNKHYPKLGFCVYGGNGKFMWVEN